MMESQRIRGGLVSVSFRKLSPREIADLVARAGLEGIEWGGDVHAPHGDLARAREAAALTRDAGLACSSYGSYYHLAVSESAGLSFERILASARELAAPVIRVWAGASGSASTGEAQRAAVVKDGLRVADLAAREGLTVALEYHNNTLTDTPESVARLMGELDHPALRFMWQPAPDRGPDSHRAELRRVLPRLGNLHVYCWVMKGKELVREPLESGASVWPGYLADVRAAGLAPWALLEFVRGDDPAQFLRDAAILKGWLA